jgi:single-strand DNA-binding protein
MNVLTVAGQLGKDAEVRYTQGGDPVANFSVADQQGKDRETVWWNCQLYGKRAESLSKYLVKGQAVTITGNITTNKYTDKNGIERIGYNIRVNDIALQGGKKEGESTPPKAAPQAKEFEDDSSIPF